MFETPDTDNVKGDETPPVTDKVKGGETGGEKPAGRFNTSDGLSDITLIVEDKKLYVHKMVLALNSPFFRQMFFSTSDFKERTASEITLVGKTYQAFVNFLHQVYPGPPSKTPIQDDTVKDMLALADEYQVEFLVDKCTDFVKQQLESKGDALNVEQTMRYLYLCHKYGHCLSLWDQFWKLATTKDYREVKENEHFEQLPYEHRSELLDLRCTRLESGISSIKVVIKSMSEISHLSNRGNQNCDGHGNGMTVCDRCPIHKLKSKISGVLSEINESGKRQASATLPQASVPYCFGSSVSQFSTAGGGLSGFTFSSSSS